MSMSFILANLSTQRTVRDNVLWSFVSAREMGVGVDRNKAVYDAVQGTTLADVKAFHDKWVKGRKYTYSILGDRNDIDMDYLRTLGPVHRSKPVASCSVIRTPRAEEVRPPEPVGTEDATDPVVPVCTAFFLNRFENPRRSAVDLPSRRTISYDYFAGRAEKHENETPIL